MTAGLFIHHTGTQQQQHSAGDVLVHTWSNIHSRFISVLVSFISRGKRLCLAAGCYVHQLVSNCDWKHLPAQVISGFISDIFYVYVVMWKQSTLCCGHHHKTRVSVSRTQSSLLEGSAHRESVWILCCEPNTRNKRNAFRRYSCMKNNPRERLFNP